MFALNFLSPVVARPLLVVASAVRKILMLAGVVFLLGLAGTYHGHAGLVSGLQAMFPGELGATETTLTAPPLADDIQSVSLQDEPRLLPSMRAALNHVSRRYKVSNEALLPIFQAAQHSARELGLDPLLIIAVIGVESGFNPFSQSVVGAQGLMQVMPRFHADKLPDDAGELPFFDPVTNVQVGARVLKESIVRHGGLVRGLQQFGGAVNDVERRYASKVLAEKARLEQAVQRLQKA